MASISREVERAKKRRQNPELTKPRSAEEEEQGTSVIGSHMDAAPIHRERAIAEIAYLLAEKRGFAAGLRAR